MSSAPTDGGPAFPEPMVQHNDQWVGVSAFTGERGMSLRDYFAAKAMQAIYTRLGGSPVDADKASNDYAAHHAYEMADAMLRARTA